jgi:hypothetical protein
MGRALDIWLRIVNGREDSGVTKHINISGEAKAGGKPVAASASTPRQARYSCKSDLLKKREGSV